MNPRIVLSPLARDAARRELDYLDDLELRIMNTPPSDDTNARIWRLSQRRRRLRRALDGMGEAA